MEDLIFARAGERSQTSGLQAEWLESQFKTANSSNLELAFANIASDKQAPVKEKLDGTTKAEADKLDKELRDFADSKLSDPSRNMEKFQKAVGKFCDAKDKEASLDELSDTWSKINTQMSIGAEALYTARKDLAENTPGRKELEAAYKVKQNQFFDKMNNLPFEESDRVMNLIIHQRGETKQQYRDRVHQGLAGSKTMTAAFDAMEAAEDNIDANKSPREKQLEYLGQQIKSESQIMVDQVEKAYVRSTIK